MLGSFLWLGLKKSFILLFYIFRHSSAMQLRPAFNCDHPASLPKSWAYMHVLLSAASFQVMETVSL